MTSSLTVSYPNDTLLNFLLTADLSLCVCASVCLSAFMITCKLDLGYIFQQGGA